MTLAEATASGSAALTGPCQASQAAVSDARAASADRWCAGRIRRASHQNGAADAGRLHAGEPRAIEPPRHLARATNRGPGRTGRAGEGAADDPRRRALPLRHER